MKDIIQLIEDTEYCKDILYRDAVSQISSMAMSLKHDLHEADKLFSIASVAIAYGVWNMFDVEAALHRAITYIPRKNQELTTRFNALIKQIEMLKESL